MTTKAKNQNGLSGGNWSHVPGLADGYAALWRTMAGEWSGAGRSLAHANLEAMMLMSRRAMAYAELPSRWSACRQPQDVLRLQTEFWQDCVKQYASSNRRIWQHLSDLQVLTGVDESLSDPESADLECTKERDYITFPEPATPGKEQGEQRVAAGERRRRPAA